MTRAVVAGILVAILACLASENASCTNEHAAPETMAGIAGGGPVSLQLPRPQIASV
jgi:hypothetical protein